MDTDIDIRAGRVNPAEMEKNNMRKPIFKTWDYDAIPWYMLDEDMYTIEEVVYDDYDPALDGSTEYFVYLK